MNYVDHKIRNIQNIGQMFSGIARHYDLLNHVLSFGLDFRWRKKVAIETKRVDCEKILDVCTGTGDMAIELYRTWQGKVEIDGLDISNELINIGKEKIRKLNCKDKVKFIEANAERLPYDDNQFDAVTITFGLRNISDRLKAVKEFCRVAKYGGCFVCLEFSHPVNSFFAKLYNFYLMKCVPFIASIVGSDPSAYRYLGNTIKEFLKPEELSQLIESAGWRDVSFQRLTGGIVTIHRAIKR